jgi:DNA helicase II / ATP-dependent DNA helicase PcrA
MEDLVAAGGVQYTPAQRQAIETVDQHLQIIACAGSGKTQVVSARIVEILARGRETAPGWHRTG